MTDDIYQPNAVELATELTIAWLSNPNTRTSADDVPAFLSQMHASVQSLVGGSQASEVRIPMIARSHSDLMARSVPI